MERIRKEQREKKEAEKRKAEMEAKKRASAQAATTAAKPRRFAWYFFLMRHVMWCNRQSKRLSPLKSWV